VKNMGITNGRLEKEISELEKVRSKINDFPKIIRDYYYYLEAAEKSYNTIKVYINYVKNLMDYCTNGKYDEYFYKKITSAVINEYMSSIRYKTGSNGETIKIGNEIRATRWSALNTFFMYLKSNQLINSNPMEQTFRPSCKQDKSVTFLTEDEIKQCINSVYQKCNEKFINRDVCIVSLAVSIGLRVSAITQINLEDIDFETNTLRVVEKGNKYRVMNFGKNLRQKLIAWCDDRDKYFYDVQTNALFVSKKRNRISVSAVEDMIAKYTQSINKHITPHKLRATCATNLYKKTGDIYMVAEQLGHTNIATSKIYTKIDHEAKLKATNILDGLI
jgi:site-specific recombinase XerC